jgi:hypothetical protein
MMLRSRRFSLAASHGLRAPVVGVVDILKVLACDTASYERARCIAVVEEEVRRQRTEGFVLDEETKGYRNLT